MDAQAQVNAQKRRERSERSEQRRQAVAARLKQVLPESLSAATLRNPPMSQEQIMQQDMEEARRFVHAAPVKILAAALLQCRWLLRRLVTLPVQLPQALHRQWTALFASQRYENFLMAEGERVWYWRNRTENERWFWEVFFWDRLLVPVLWTIGYEIIVPNNFIWSVIVPLSFIVWQSGDLPSIWSPQSWLIAYFGFFKSADQLLWLLDALFRWW